jgi:hypothetical protein
MGVMNEISQILKPWVYLAISGRRKWVFDWGLPAFLTATAVGCWLFFGLKIGFYKSGGTISQITSFVQNLPGFFVAALAAVATFNRADLDRDMPDPAPTMPMAIRGRMKRLPLTRRRFLCVLFAYLTSQSIVLTLVGISFVSLSDPIRSALSSRLVEWFYFGGATIYIFLLFQMIVVTYLGLYYLGDRIHQPDL